MAEVVVGMVVAVGHGVIDGQRDFEMMGSSIGPTARGRGFLEDGFFDFVCFRYLPDSASQCVNNRSGI